VPIMPEGAEGATVPDASKLTSQQQADRLQSSKTAGALSKKWDRIAETHTLPSASKVKSLIRKGGVDSKHRAWVWAELSGATLLRSSKPATYFRDLPATADVNSNSVKQIELDLPRTNPEHIWLRGQEGQAALRSVLIAYSMHDQQVGYCQGLNFIVGSLLLCVDRDPESAFWLLIALTDHILYPGTYAPYLPGFQVEMLTLANLVQKKLPRLHRHLEHLGCEIHLLATDWFICLYITTLPVEVALRVWDSLFCEGAKILYRVALALLQLHEQLLLSCDNAGDVLHTMKESSRAWWNADKLMATAFRKVGSLPFRKIVKLRRSQQGPVDALVHEREVTRRTQDLKDEDRQKQRQVQLEAEQKAQLEAQREAQLEAERQAQMEAEAQIPQEIPDVNPAAVETASKAVAGHGSVPTGEAAHDSVLLVSDPETAADDESTIGR